MKKILTKILSIALAITIVVSSLETTASAKESVNQRFSNSIQKTQITYSSKTVTINNKTYTKSDIDRLLNTAIKLDTSAKLNNSVKSSISYLSGERTRAAVAAAGAYFIPGVGQVLITVTGVVIVGGVVISLGSWLGKKISKWFSTQKEIENAKKKIPSRLKKSNGNLDLSKFNKNKKNKKYESKGFSISKDNSEHKGPGWKVFNKSGDRIATVDSNGKVVGK